MRYFSNATQHPNFNQNKRHFNHRIKEMLASGISQRRMARLLHLSRTTVNKKLIFLGNEALLKLEESNLAHPPADLVQFDDMETFEHTKCKPLSITLMVEQQSRRILGIDVAKMPAKGLLAKIARKKYGHRADERAKKRSELFQKLSPLVSPSATIKSDENPHYVNDVKTYFPSAVHQRHKGQRGSIVGQGELKKVRFDPLFSLNHTCAMIRANVNRMFRKTWCTTKKPENLKLHLAIYAVYHNLTLINGA